MRHKHRNKRRKTHRSPVSDRQRTAIAQEAARILAEGHSTDFSAARRKAADRLGQGVFELRDLPGNQEIEQALLDYRALFSPAQHQQDLAKLRNAALNVMKLLNSYQPRLVGPVLSGSADKDSRVTLHVYADRAEDIYLTLLARGIPAEDGEKRLKIRKANGDLKVEGFPQYQFIGGDVSVELVVMPLSYLHRPPISKLDGKPMQQVRQRELEELIKA